MQAESTHDRILAVAAEYFVDEGFRHARMVELASRAGIARATLYKHFDTKEALLLALNDKVIDSARGQMAVLTNRLDDDETVAARIAQWLELGLTDRWWLNTLRLVVLEDTQEALLGDEGATAGIVDQVSKALVSLIREGIKREEFRAEIQPRETARAIQAALLGLQRNHVSVRPLVPLKSGNQVAAFIHLVIAGLRKGFEP
ncbi:MAG: TetR/AcrR family transcriptional regulator [Pseudomonadota bacterium]